MNYKIEGDFSPVLTIFLSKNELLSAKVGSDGWFSPKICGISPADNIIDALFPRTGFSHGNTPPVPTMRR